MNLGFITEFSEKTIEKGVGAEIRVSLIYFEMKCVYCFVCLCHTKSLYIYIYFVFFVFFIYCILLGISA